MQLFGIISAAFDIADQLVIRLFAFVRYWGGMGNQLFIGLKKACDILIGCWIPTK
jgi:hypothetical protein